MQRTASRVVLALSGAALCLAASTAGAAVVTFDSGSEGWSINGWDTPDLAGGNPGANLRWADFIDTFGLEIRTDSDDRFTGDYGARGPVTLSVDVNTNYIQFFGQDVSRDLVVELRDYDNAGSYPYVSVWTTIGTLAGGSGWQTFSATISDPNSLTLPAGWGGTGDEDPNTFEPRLPANRSFADVLASVDQVLFTTYTPGFFYGFTHFDISVDNISITSVPAPGAATLAGAIGLVGLRRRR